MAHGRDAEARLAALGAHLGARRLKVELTEGGLRVENPDADGCCLDAPRPCDTITCRPRPEDGGVLWFYTSWQEPIAPADQVIDTTVAILGYLSGRRAAR